MEEQLVTMARVTMAEAMAASVVPAVEVLEAEMTIHMILRFK